MDPAAAVKIGATGVAALASALEKNATLELLSLGGALLVAVAWLAPALCHSLQYVIISCGFPIVL